MAGGSVVAGIRDSAREAQITFGIIIFPLDEEAGEGPVCRQINNLKQGWIEGEVSLKDVDRGGDPLEIDRDWEYLANFVLILGGN